MNLEWMPVGKGGGGRYLKEGRFVKFRHFGEQ